MKTADTPIVSPPREPAMPSGASAAGDAPPFEIVLLGQLPDGVLPEEAYVGTCQKMLGEAHDEDIAAEEAAVNDAAAAQAIIVAIEPPLILPPESAAPTSAASQSVIEPPAKSVESPASAERSELSTLPPELDAADAAHVVAESPNPKNVKTNLVHHQSGEAAAEPRAEDRQSEVKPESSGAVTDPATASVDTFDPPLASFPEVSLPEPKEPPASTSAPSVSAITPSTDGSHPAPPSRAAPEPGSQAAPPVEIDSPRLLARVARAIHLARQRGGELTLRLSPPELGSLRLELRVEDGVMTARLEAETEVARSALIEHLPVLRERLAEQGIRIEHFDVDLMQQRGQEPGGREQRPEWERGTVGEGESGRSANRRTENNLPLAPSPTLPLSATSGLNVVI